MQMARPRKNDLPANLNRTRKSKGYYYYYRNPKTKVDTGLGYDKAAAVEAAIEANNILSVKKVILDTHKFGAWLDRFEAEILPQRQVKGKPLSEVTMADYKLIIRSWRKWADWTFDDLDLEEISNHLDALSPNSSNKHRFLLALCFRYAISKGLTQFNPAEATIPKSVSVKRQRLNIQGFRAIYGVSPPWLRNAMDIALHSLQRRGDIAWMRFDKIKDGVQSVIQHKTEKHGACAYLKIHVSTEYQAILDRCRDDISCPYVVHDMPTAPRHNRGWKNMSRNKAHPFQCTPEKITRAFKKARDDCGYFDDVKDMRMRPSFHEIRALGADLLRSQGWKESEIQKLLGHTTEKQTMVYLDRHEERWTEVKTGLVIDP